MSVRGEDPQYRPLAGVARRVPTPPTDPEAEAGEPAAPAAVNVTPGCSPARAQRHLFAVTAAVCFALVGYMYWVDLSPDSSLVVLVFLAGALGGLLSAYRRFRLLAVEDVHETPILPSGVIVHAYISPLLGGIFGIILYLVMLTGIIEGDFFPRFRNLDQTYEGLFTLFHTAGPAENKDAVKVVFWAFVAGFSERLVPDVVGRVAQR